jgi:hypothetical protein
MAGKVLNGDARNGMRMFESGQTDAEMLENN